MINDGFPSLPQQPRPPVPADAPCPGAGSRSKPTGRLKTQGLGSKENQPLSPLFPNTKHVGVSPTSTVLELSGHQPGVLPFNSDTTHPESAHTPQATGYPTGVPALQMPVPSPGLPILLTD